MEHLNDSQTNFHHNNTDTRKLIIQNQYNHVKNIYQSCLPYFKDYEIYCYSDEKIILENLELLLMDSCLPYVFDELKCSLQDNTSSTNNMTISNSSDLSLAKKGLYVSLSNSPEAKNIDSASCSDMTSSQYQKVLSDLNYNEFPKIFKSDNLQNLVTSIINSVILAEASDKNSANENSIDLSQSIFKNFDISDLKSQNLKKLITTNYLKLASNNFWHNYVKILLYTIFGSQGLTKFQVDNEAHYISELEIFGEEYDQTKLTIKAIWTIHEDRRISNLMNDLNNVFDPDLDDGYYGEVEVVYSVKNRISASSEGSATKYSYETKFKLLNVNETFLKENIDYTQSRQFIFSSLEYKSDLAVEMMSLSTAGDRGNVNDYPQPRFMSTVGHQNYNNQQNHQLRNGNQRSHYNNKHIPNNIEKMPTLHSIVYNDDIDDDFRDFSKMNIDHHENGTTRQMDRNTFNPPSIFSEEEMPSSSKSTPLKQASSTWPFIGK